MLAHAAAEKKLKRARASQVFAPARFFVCHVCVEFSHVINSR